MALAVFPATSSFKGLAWPIDKTAAFSTIVQTAPNALDTTVSQTRNPRWTWMLIFEYLNGDRAKLPAGQTYTDYERLQGFQLAVSGAGGEFLFSDPSDNAVGPALLTGGAPNLQAQLQIVNDGAGTYYSPVQRNFGGQFYEDITDLNGALTVYANGVLQTTPTNYTLVGPGLAIAGQSFMGLVIKWVGVPAGPVTAAFNFYFRVRLGDDAQSFSEFAQAFWSAGGSEGGNSAPLKLVSSPPVLA